MTLETMTLRQPALSALGSSASPLATPLPRVLRPQRAVPADAVRPTRAEVNLAHLRHNLRVMQRTAGGAQVWAVLKADGYGHGAKGVARTLVYDNLRSAVLERAGTAIRFHPRLLELAGHYHFAPRPCTPGRGNEKGKVERQILYLRQAFFAARTFVDVDDLNPAFAALRAGDFEVVQLGWRPPAGPRPDPGGTLHPLPRCRLLDTTATTGPRGGPTLARQGFRSRFHLRSREPPRPHPAQRWPSLKSS